MLSCCLFILVLVLFFFVHVYLCTRHVIKGWALSKLAVRIILPPLFDHVPVVERFSIDLYNEVHFETFCLPVKLSCLPGSLYNQTS